MNDSLLNEKDSIVGINGKTTITVEFDIDIAGVKIHVSGTKEDAGWNFEGKTDEAIDFQITNLVNYLRTEAKIDISLPDVDLKAKALYVSLKTYERPRPGYKFGFIAQFDINSDNHSRFRPKNLVLFFTKTDKRTIAGLRVDAGFGFCNLPLVGEVAGLKDAYIDNVGLVYASDCDEHEILILDKDDQNKSTIGWKSFKPGEGLVVTSEICIPGETDPIQWSIPLSTTTNGTNDKSQTTTNKSGEITLPIIVDTSQPVSSSPVKWIPINKTFGPVNLEKIGLSYTDGRFLVSITASFTMACFSLDVQGLAINVGFKKPYVEFGIDGLGLNIVRGSLQIAGAFLHSSWKEDSTGEWIDGYFGEALVKAGKFALIAIGGYARTGTVKSFFIFIKLDYPLGGPPCFFITGLAGGFGLNRSLEVPAIEQVPEFPLLGNGSAGNSTPVPQPTERERIGSALNRIIEITALAPGENWIAAGISFTSFQMVKSKALVIVSFGAKLEITLLGISRITLPKVSKAQQSQIKPIAFTEIALKAHFSDDSYLLSVEGYITPASYIYSSLCHITGGFAFYAWFAGDHEGDFVITLGGYHPEFQKPPHYPSVPRLSLNYQVDNLIIKGKSYVALTPCMIMSGMSIEATWHSGNLKAWFNAGVDFLLGWRPFIYDARAYVQIGASFTIRKLHTTFSKTIHVGVWLHILGPPFSGQAVIDLDIIRFAIEFGETQQIEKPIGWDDFKNSFLPVKEIEEGANQLSSNGKKGQYDDFCTASVKDGLLKDLRNGDKKEDQVSWVVDPNHFAIVTATVIPAKCASFNNTGDTEWKKQNGDDENNVKDFGILPMGLPTDKFSSVHNVEINRCELEKQNDVKSQIINSVAVKKILKNAPKALWAGESAAYTSRLKDDKQMIVNVLFGLQFSPLIEQPSETQERDLKDLLFGNGKPDLLSKPPSKPDIAWDESDVTIEEDEDGKTLVKYKNGTIVQNYKITGLTDKDVVKKRSEIVESLKSIELIIDSSRLEVDKLAEYPLWDRPIIRPLGAEQK